MNILYVELSKIPQIGEFLDFMTDPEKKAGKKTDRYWIINTKANLRGEGNIGYFNSLMQQCLHRGYESIMILNK